MFNSQKTGWKWNSPVDRVPLLSLKTAPDKYAPNCITHGSSAVLQAVRESRIINLLRSFWVLKAFFRCFTSCSSQVIILLRSFWVLPVVVPTWQFGFLVSRTSGVRSFTDMITSLRTVILIKFCRWRSSPSNFQTALWLVLASAADIQLEH